MGYISSLFSNNPQHCSTCFNLPVYSLVAFLSLECPNFIFSGAKRLGLHPMSLTRWEPQVPNGEPGHGKGVVQNFSYSPPLSHFFTLVTSLGSQGLLQSPSYEKLVGCCLMPGGVLTPSVTLPSSSPPSAGFTLGRRECLFSLF